MGDTDTIHHSTRNSHKQHSTAQGTAVLMAQTIYHNTKNSCADSTATNNTRQHKEGIARYVL